MPEKKTTSPKVTISLEGEIEQAFQIIKDHIEKSSPGVKPRRIDIGRFAILMTAAKIANDNEEQGQ